MQGGSPQLEVWLQTLLTITVHIWICMCKYGYESKSCYPGSLGTLK